MGRSTVTLGPTGRTLLGLLVAFFALLYPPHLAWAKGPARSANSTRRSSRSRERRRSTASPWPWRTQLSLRLGITKSDSPRRSWRSFNRHLVPWQPPVVTITPCSVVVVSARGRSATWCGVPAVLRAGSFKRRSFRPRRSGLRSSSGSASPMAITTWPRPWQITISPQANMASPPTGPVTACCVRSPCRKEAAEAWAWRCWFRLRRKRIDGWPASCNLLLQRGWI